MMQDGNVSMKPPGHIGGFIDYVQQKMKADIVKGVQVVLLNSGEELGMTVDASIINYVAQGDKCLYFNIIPSAIPSGGRVVSVNGKNLILERSQFPPGAYQPSGYKNTFQVMLNIDNILQALNVDRNTFSGMSDQMIHNLLIQKILIRLKPITEVKPIDNYAQWVVQFEYLFGQLSWILPTDFILKDREYAKLFFEIKDKEDIINVKDQIQALYGRVIEEFFQ
jgi:UDP-N-acetylglucosamine pyrophosphorylase